MMRYDSSDEDIHHHAGSHKKGNSPLIFFLSSFAKEFYSEFFI